MKDAYIVFIEIIQTQKMYKSPKSLDIMTVHKDDFKSNKMQSSQKKGKEMVQKAISLQIWIHLN